MVHHIKTTFNQLVKKLEKLREEGLPVNEQLAVIDFWIGQLFLLRANIGHGFPLDSDWE